MAKKSEVNRALSPAHLQAIGAVAAAWASLEFMMLIAIAKVSKIDTYAVLILSGPSNLTVWIESLTKFATRSKDHSFKLDELNPIFTKIKDLQTKRNGIVHALWHPERIGTGILGSIELPVTRKSTAIGMELPKRGKKPVTTIRYTASEMRKVAKEIPECEEALLSWLAKKKPSPELHRNMLAAALRASPNPHQKNPKPQARKKPSPV